MRLLKLIFVGLLMTLLPLVQGEISGNITIENKPHIGATLIFRITLFPDIDGRVLVSAVYFDGMDITSEVLSGKGSLGFLTEKEIIFEHSGDYDSTFLYLRLKRTLAEKLYGRTFSGISDYRFLLSDKNHTIKVIFSNGYALQKTFYVPPETQRDIPTYFGVSFVGLFFLFEIFRHKPSEVRAHVYFILLGTLLFFLLLLDRIIVVQNYFDFADNLLNILSVYIFLHLIYLFVWFQRGVKSGYSGIFVIPMIPILGVAYHFFGAAAFVVFGIMLLIVWDREVSDGISPKTALLLNVLYTIMGLIFANYFGAKPFSARLFFAIASIYTVLIFKYREYVYASVRRDRT
ncbi:hypothetical protein [Thermococcus barophilus]|uniref:Uncharacterized protein n=1 Tax=Thermococcus barophilus (strain DSM 11836 / MP) TaxID=391623 RepID=F0LJT3_THEBM|nr:hypothetical protein [Thermococcus barophilus]ADT84725.1 hypothetical protein TERMP_01750 [Thermococcus barophilus MP]